MRQSASIALPALGEPVTVTTDHGVVITLILFATHAAVNVWHGTSRVEAWTRTFADKAVACAEASRALAAFRAHAGEAGIERRRTELALVIAEQEARQSRRMHDQELLDAARAESEALMTFQDKELLERLRADLADLYRAA